MPVFVDAGDITPLARRLSPRLLFPALNHHPEASAAAAGGADVIVHPPSGRDEVAADRRGAGGPSRLRDDRRTHLLVPGGDQGPSRRREADGQLVVVAQVAVRPATGARHHADRADITSAAAAQHDRSARSELLGTK